MEKMLSIVIILFTFIVILLLGLIAFLFFYVMKQNKGDKKEKKKDLELGEKKSIYGFCFNHSDQHAQGTCAICENSFCEKCLWEHEKTHFCPEHYRLFMDSKWVELSRVHSTPDTPEAALALYDLKAQAWKNKVPTYIVTHYKINFEGDQIESHVVLYGREQEASELHLQLQLLEKTHEASRKN